LVTPQTQAELEGDREGRLARRDWPLDAQLRHGHSLTGIVTTRDGSAAHKAPFFGGRLERLASVAWRDDVRDRYRVAVYVFDAHGKVLCFDHADFPEAGTQIPAGGVDRFETLEAAAAREVLEETGIRITPARALGVQVIEDQASQVRKVTVFLAARALQVPAERWRHTVAPQAGQDAGMVFECFFLDVRQATAVLRIDRQAEFLPLVPSDWHAGAF
jgi:8-oxo-dGTP pyrophosphatase MutT (NUDIX family)